MSLTSFEHTKSAMPQKIARMIHPLTSSALHDNDSLLRKPPEKDILILYRILLRPAAAVIVVRNRVDKSQRNLAPVPKDAHTLYFYTLTTNSDSVPFNWDRQPEESVTQSTPWTQVQIQTCPHRGEQKQKQCDSDAPRHQLEWQMETDSRIRGDLRSF